LSIEVLVSADDRPHRLRGYPCQRRRSRPTRVGSFVVLNLLWDRERTVFRHGSAHALRPPPRSSTGAASTWSRSTTASSAPWSWASPP